MNVQVQQNKDFANQNAHTSELMRQMTSKLDAMATHNKMLETQISQVAQQQVTIAAPTGTFPIRATMLCLLQTQHLLFHLVIRMEPLKLHKHLESKISKS